MTRPLAAAVGLAAFLLAIGFSDGRSAEPTNTAPAWDEEIHAARCPAWAKDSLAPELQPYVGKFGLPDPFRQRQGPLGKGVAGIDRWQANRFIVYRPETARFLDSQYTPVRVDYKRGSLPSYEKLVDEYTRGRTTDCDKALALLTRAMAERFPHPTMPPLGPPCRADRALLDEDLLKSGCGFCNEQARVYVRLCQVAGIPARMVYLFYSDKRTGHTIAEIYLDGHWAMADASWFCVFPGADGRWMSAAECHEEGPNRLRVGEAYVARMKQIIALDDERLVGRHVLPEGDSAARRQKVAAEAAKVRTGLREKTARFLGDQLWKFGILNYPLPH
jgi:hypothetical protein